MHTSEPLASISIFKLHDEIDQVPYVHLNRAVRHVDARAHRQTRETRKCVQPGIRVER